MEKRYMLLSEWCKNHGLPLNPMKDQVRRGRLKGVVKLKLVPTERMVIPADYPPFTIGPRGRKPKQHG